MKHASREALDKLEHLLAAIREVSPLQERSPGTFYIRSSAFLHFHEGPAGLFADLKMGKDWRRFPVNTRAECKTLLQEVHATTAKLRR
jgi:hypothetical protein